MKKSVKELMTALLAAVMLLTLAFCAVDAQAEAAGTKLELGDTGYSLVIPAGFVPGEVSAMDLELGQVGYYYSDDTLMDFDVYQIGKDGQPSDLAGYAAEATAQQENVTELATDAEINGIPVAYYRLVEEYDEAEYETLTYVLDAGEDYVVIVFWLDGETAEEEVAAIIQTLSGPAVEE